MMSSKYTVMQNSSRVYRINIDAALPITGPLVSGFNRYLFDDSVIVQFLSTVAPLRLGPAQL